MNKGCNICDVELDDHNWFSSFKKSHTYRCKDCHRERCRPHRKNRKPNQADPNTIDKDCRICKTKLVVDFNYRLRNHKRHIYLCNPCENSETTKGIKVGLQRRRDESKPGVYMIFEDNILVYIGESIQCKYRVWDHFHTSPNVKSYVGVDKKRKDDYECVQLCVEEDKYKRLALELELIAVYKPKYNSPYKNIYVGNPQLYPLVDHEILLKKRVLESLDFDFFGLSGF